MGCKQQINASFLNELMERVDIRNYCKAMQDELEKQSKKNRILQALNVELPLWRTGAKFGIGNLGSAGSRRLVVTNNKLLVMEAPKHGQLTQRCNLCPPDSFCPVGPGIDTEYAYTDLTRIVAGADSQLVILGWIVRSQQLTAG